MAGKKSSAGQSGKKGGSIIDAPFDSPTQQKKAKKGKKQSRGK